MDRRRRRPRNFFPRSFLFHSLPRESPWAKRRRAFQLLQLHVFRHGNLQRNSLKVSHVFGRLLPQPAGHLQRRFLQVDRREEGLDLDERVDDVVGNDEAVEVGEAPVFQIEELGRLAVLAVDGGTRD